MWSRGPASRSSCRSARRLHEDLWDQPNSHCRNDGDRFDAVPPFAGAWQGPLRTGGGMSSLIAPAAPFLWERAPATGDWPVVVVVDDDHECLEEICELLGLLNVGLYATSDPSLALQKAIMDPRVAVVIADLRMPDRNGVSLCRSLRDATANRHLLQLLIMTAFPSLDSSLEAMRLGVCDYIEKPINIAALRDSVLRAIGKAQYSLSTAQDTTTVGRVQTVVDTSNAGAISVLPGRGGLSEAGVIELLARLSGERCRIFADYACDEAAVSILLDVYKTQLQKKRLSVTAFCVMNDVSQSTALRRITALANAGLIEREDDGKDARRSLLSTTPNGQEVIQRYLAAIAHLLGSIPAE